MTDKTPSIHSDFRRYCRPFFLDPRTGKPTPQKRYYDAMSYVVTQMVFSFTTAPFILLSLSASLRCWAQLYFYIIIGTAISTAFFASPYRRILQTRLAERQPAQAPSSPRDAKGAAAAPMARATSSDSINGGAPVLGLSDDPQADIDEAVRELKDFRSQVEARLAESRHAKQRHHAKSG